MIGRLLERFIRKRAQEVVNEMVQIRNHLTENGVDVTPYEVLRVFAGENWRDVESVMISADPQSETIICCLRSFEGLAYWIEMDGTQTLGRLMVQRWWSYCNYVDDFVRDAGFPIQTKETKALIFHQLEIDKGNFRNYL